MSKRTETRVVLDEDGEPQAQQPARTRRQNTPPPPPGQGRGRTKWSYTYADLARLFGMSEGAVRTAVYRGKVRPGDLASVIRFWQDRRPRGG